MLKCPWCECELFSKHPIWCERPIFPNDKKNNDLGVKNSTDTESVRVI